MGKHRFVKIAVSSSNSNRSFFAHPLSAPSLLSSFRESLHPRGQAIPGPLHILDPGGNKVSFLTLLRLSHVQKAQRNLRPLLLQAQGILFKYPLWN